jgi:hypothetical protein
MNRLLAIGILALLLTPLALAEEQPNTYPSEEEPQFPGDPPASCTPVFIFTDPVGVGLNRHCIDETLPPVGGLLP